MPEPEPISTRHHVLILQHPQEPDKELGSAKLAASALEHCTLKVGLSWRNLSAALGREAQASHWGVLYLGSGVKTPAGDRGRELGTGLHFVSRAGAPLAPAEEAKIRETLEGIVVLDGTWTQAKALWWRNPWLLKLRRAILIPSDKSLYGALRKEPRRECLSTIESIAEALVDLGESPETGEKLRARFKAMLEEYRKMPSSKQGRGA